MSHSNSIGEHQVKQQLVNDSGIANMLPMSTGWIETLEVAND